MGKYVLEDANVEVTNDKPHIILIALYNFRSFSIRTLFTTLKKHGYKTTCIFFKDLRDNDTEPPSDNEINKLVGLLKKLKPTIVGISVVSSFYNIASSITKEIRYNLSIPVLWGGPHPTIVPEQCVTIADMVCVGEGDQVILDLAKALSDGKEIKNIGNLWINKNGSVTKNPLRPLLQDLNWIPYIDWGNNNKFYIENNSVLEGDPIWGQGPSPHFYELMASRGCPFHCTYCSNSIFKEIFKNKGSFVKRRSVDNIIKELLIAKKQLHIKRVFFHDEVFVLDEKWLSDFCKKYKDAIGLPFGCELHPSVIREKAIALLADAGLDDVVLGIQSGSEQTRKHIFERFYSNRSIEELAKLFHKHGIMPCYDVIMDNPFEGENDKRETINLLLRLPRPFNLTMYSLCWFPRTKLTEKALKEGIIKEEMVEGSANKTFTHWRMRLDREIQKEDQFWDSLVFLNVLRFNTFRYSRSIHIIPKCIIRSLTNNTFIRKHPKILTLPTLILGSLIAPWKLRGFPIAECFLRLYTILYFRLKLISLGK